MPVDQTKNNFWPRPRDENTDFLLTTVLEHDLSASITAMAVWDGWLYYATGRNSALPRLFRWDGQNAPQQVATPAWNNPPAAATFTINVMAVYGGELWIATSPNGVAAPNQVIEIWSYNGTAWTDGKLRAGWAAAPLNPCESIANNGRGAGWMFVFNNIIFIGQDTAAAGVGIEVQGWNGATWLGAVEVVGVGGVGPAAGNSTEPTSRMHGPIFNNEVYAGAYDDRAAGVGGTGDAEVYRRSVAGVWTLDFTFPDDGTVPTDPVEVLVLVDNNVYAAHGNVVNALSGSPTQLACVTTTPEQVRATQLGFRSGFTVASQLAQASGTEVALLASPEKLWVFNPTTWNLELLAEFRDDAPLDIVDFLDRIYVSQGSDLLMAVNSGLLTARIARLD